MRSNDEIQQTLVTYLKAQGTLVSYLANSGQVKEDQWQGTSFTYPAVRVAITSQTPQNGSLDCSLSNLIFSIWVFTEDASSKNCDKICGEVNKLLHRKQVQGVVNLFSISSTSLDSATRQDERTWVSQAQFRAMLT